MTDQQQPATKSPYQRMKAAWLILTKRQRCGLSTMAGLPADIGHKEWHEMAVDEAKALINALRAAGVLCDIIHDDSEGVPL